ncbi:ABC transporter ATP-binding protein [bacterium]|nr:MAG: ABC transporter ATP-binding protein [bacterium]
MNNSVIQAVNLTKVYNKGGGGEVYAVHDVSLKILKGEYVAIMGASGSGKSTLMNILGCLDKPTGGSLKLDGVEVSTLTDEELAKVRNRKIGFVFQSFNLLARTNALENVELPLIYSDRTDITRLAREALVSVGLADRTHHTPGELSGGQQQRVAIARALVTDPEIIFADEPTGNLDTRSSLEIMSLFQQLNEKGRTIVLVTHEADISEHAHRIIKIADGRIISDEVNPEPRVAEQEMSTLVSKEVTNENR